MTTVDPLPIADVASPAALADFDAVFLGSHDRLVRTLTLICGDREVAADCVADAFERAYARWRRIGRYEDPVGWIRRVAVHRARDVHRRGERGRRAVERLSGRTEVVAHDPTPPDEALLAAVAALPLRQRTVVALHYLDDLPVADIARALRVSEGTVKSNLHDARARLRTRLPSEDTP